MQYDKGKAKVNADRSALAVLQALHAERPDLWRRAQLVGRWVWVAFEAAPPAETRVYLLEAGFHWNHKRQTWQHAGGVPSVHSVGDPRFRYGIIPADEAETLLAGAI